MKAWLMHRNRDFDPGAELPGQPEVLIQDLELDTLLKAMAGEDAFLFEAARKALLLGPKNDADTILYRQEIMNDCLKNAAVVRKLYDLTIEAIDRHKKKHYFSFFSRYPEGILRDSIGVLEVFVDALRRLREIADTHAGKFSSTGFLNLFGIVRQEFSDEYFTAMQNHLMELPFKGGVLLSAGLGQGNVGKDHVLRFLRDRKPNWFKRIVIKRPSGFTVRIADRDEAGWRALSELRDRGINLVANALAQSMEHILGFFVMLRTELAFYIGGLNLRDQLDLMRVPISFPRPISAGTRALRFSGLSDVCLALTMGRSVARNGVCADGKSLVIITGANQGGKTSFLRSVGLAQLMMQTGLYVAAESFEAEPCTGLFTHSRREEDPAMKSGKLDEEMERMSGIVDSMASDSLLLCNESFASTHEREGSEIARRIVRALLDKRIKVFFVTHLYEFAHGFLDRKNKEAIFLRAERRADGTRTFKLVEGDPLETSYGKDLYEEVFNVEGLDEPNGWPFM